MKLVRQLSIGTSIMLGTQIMNAEIEKAADAAVNPAQQAAPIKEVAAPKETEKVYTEAEQAAFLETYGWITFMQSGVRNLGLNAKEIESFLKGAKVAAEGKEAPQKLGEQVEDMQKFLQQKATAYEKIHQEQMKITAEKNRKAGDEFMQALLKKNNKIKTTTSGLSYEIISEGDVNVKATEVDTVEILYIGKTIDGKVFDESKEKAITFPLNGVVAGIKEGLQLVGQGGKIVLYIPDSLAYGEYDIPSIPAGSRLIFEVELVKVNKANSPEDNKKLEDSKK
ncbi:MAG: FKBP-type peptidyl-prolyl cis-trans isomerase [Opitutales bacterium]